MTWSWRWTVTCLVVVGAVAIGRTWMERTGIFALVIAFVMTIDLAGDDL